ncbi:MAG TPA: PAS domain-containing protein, partial [Puia sp.]|nr:PAS domain-containing protein [Puia sp.]
AINMAIRQRRMEKEKQEAFEAMRITNERFQILSRATRDAVWDWNLSSGWVWGNEAFFELLGFDARQKVPPPTEWGRHVHPADQAKLTARIRGIKNSRISGWEDQLRFRSLSGHFKTVLDRAYVIRNDDGKPDRVVGVFVDVTNKIEQQKLITRTILEVQEKERNLIGRELHDNINQILASVNLKLGYYLEEPLGNEEIIDLCRQNLRKAIDEGRKLSHDMVMPRFSERRLRDEIELLIDDYHYSHIAWLNSEGLDETALPHHIKETLFRIAQEHMNNIHKHAKASSIEIKLVNSPHEVSLYIRDNGVGFNTKQNRKGIGITNILSRAESYDGIARILSAPGKGCTLSVNIPY